MQVVLRNGPAASAQMPEFAGTQAATLDANKPGDLELCEDFGAEILKLCVEVGGCLTGEHGVGIEKRDIGDDARTINEQGLTIVPLDVRMLDNGEVTIRAKDPAYATPGSDEVQKF
jgi:hypothetical protein